MKNVLYSFQFIIMMGLIMYSTPAMGQFFLTSETMDPCVGCESPFPCGVEAPTSTNSIKKRFSYVPTIGKDYDRDGLHDQWLEVYIPRNTAPPPDGFPVIIHAHALGQTAEDLCFSGDRIAADGVIFVSWESVTETTRTNTNQIPSAQLAYGSGDADFQNVLKWVRDEAEGQLGLNIDLNRILVTGTSRGTRLSFNNLSSLIDLEDGSPLVRAAIYSQAFPDLEWKYSDIYGTPAPDELVQADYPPILMHFNSEFGVLNDIHDPINGHQVLEALRCEDIPSALLYNSPHTLFSSENRNTILQFLENPTEFLLDLENEVNSVGDITSDTIMKPPKNLSIEVNSDNPSKFRLKWKKNDWDQIQATTKRLDCEVRGTSVNADGFCNSLYFDQVYVNDFNQGEPISNIFRFPNEGYLNVCNLPGGLSPGETYQVQVRCVVLFDDYDPYSSVTPWSEVKYMTLPECDPFDSGNEKALSSNLIPYGKDKWELNDFMEIHVLRLVDSTGRVLEEHISPESGLIDLSSRSPGVYLVSLQRKDGGFEHFKLLKPSR